RQRGGVDHRRRDAPARHAARHARPRDAADPRGALRVPGGRAARDRLRWPEEPAPARRVRRAARARSRDDRGGAVARSPPRARRRHGGRRAGGAVIELGLLDVRGEDDVVRAHQTARTIGAQLGFSTFEQTRIATAISEIARNALIYAGGGSVSVGIDDARSALSIVVLDRGPGIPDLPAVLAGERRSATGLGVGIPGARRLMDTFAI